MDFTGLLPPSVETDSDRFDLVESLSGWRFDDVLRGDDRDAAAMVGPRPTVDAASPASAVCAPGGDQSYNAGNIILGGAGNDLIEGRGGDDVVDGDAQLTSVRCAPTRRPGHGDRLGGGPDRRTSPKSRPGCSGVLAGDVEPGAHRHRPGDPRRDGRPRTSRTRRPRRTEADYTITTKGNCLRGSSTTSAPTGPTCCASVPAACRSDRTIEASSRCPTLPVIGTATAATPRPPCGGAPVPVGRRSRHRAPDQVLATARRLALVNGIAGDATSASSGALDNDMTYTFR